MPICDMDGPQLLQWQAAQMRDDLLLGELMIALQRLTRQPARIVEPGVEIFGDRDLARIDQRARMGGADQASQLALGVTPGAADRGVAGLPLSRDCAGVELDAP